MLSAYIFSLVLGGGLLLFSLLAGDADSDVDVDLDVDIDVDLDLDVDTGADLDHGAHVAAGKLLSFRSLIYTVFGFGATGTLLTYMGFPALATAATAVVGGVLSGALVTTVFNYLRRTDSGAHPGDAGFIGLPAKVVLPLSAGSAGAILVERGGRRIRLRALPHAAAEGDPDEWTRVVVVDLEGGIARVTPVKEDHLLEP
jgi:membrane protein implicated in regulation of membrane protease activity